jgi:hypothetical protein
MLTFIIPVKSKQLSRISWKLASEIFERCLRSTCNQTSEEFRVIVVCHELPEVKFQHPHIQYIEVDFPVPTWEEPESPYRDKGRKLWTGLNYAFQMQPSHIMLVDSDDCVSKHLAEFVKQHPQDNGWFINKGYEYHEGSKKVYYRNRNFHKKCGTANIIRYDLLTSYAAIKFEDVTRDFLWHQDVAEAMQNRGSPLTPLPFKGAIYVGNTGENHVFSTEILGSFISSSREHFLYHSRRFYKWLASRSLSKKICEEFGLYKL